MAALLESPLAYEEQAKHARRRRLLQREARLTQQVARLEARLQAITTEPTKTVLQVQTRTLQRLGIGTHLYPNECVRLDILPKLDLGTAEKSTNVRLNVSRRDVEHVRANRSRCFTRGFICDNAQCHTGKLLRCERCTSTDQIVAASNTGSLELQQRRR